MNNTLTVKELDPRVDVVEKLAASLFDIEEHIEPTMRPEWKSLDYFTQEFYRTAVERFLISEEIPIREFYTCE